MAKRGQVNLPFFKSPSALQLPKYETTPPFFRTTKGKEGRKAWPAGVALLGHISAGSC